MTSTLAVARFRARCKEAGIPDRNRKKQKEYKRDHKRTKSREDRPFIGCDGEGCGKDEHGRQLYTLFRMGERELFRGGCHLGTAELLDFICEEPAGSILVGFAFGYDTTMILRDLSPGQQKRLFEPKTFGEGHSPFVWYKDFNIDYLPRQYLKVSRVRTERGADGTEKRIPIKGSQRIIYETFGFFQKSFVKVIDEFDVGDEAGRISIAADKSRRADFSEIGERERQYCALECDYLAELMEKLRGYCHAAGIVPRTWSGAGKLAAALHALHETPKSAAVADCVPRDVLDLANMAYYGGRFEITRVGKIEEKVYEYDIRSAYPDAMRRLPCLEHGCWEAVGAKELQSLSRSVGERTERDNLFIAVCTFKSADKKHRGSAGVGQLGGLPVRSKEGHLYWPAQGGGVYWSCEIASAERLGYAIKYKSGYQFKSNCDCKPFDWVDTLYEYRKSIGGSGPGYPIKLGINSLYGKLAQRKGNGSYNNMVWAGLITAMTRAKLNDAISLNPGRIVMVATDAVYSLDPLPALSCGERLGDWEATELDGLFIVQPGLYWCPALRKRKSRGLSGRFFEEAGRTESFEVAWEQWREFENSKVLTDFPTVSVPVPGFIGLKLAISRNKPLSAGTWVNDKRDISFDYRNKRQGHDWDKNCIVTCIKAGHAGLVSLPHRDFLKAGGQEPWELARLMLEEQPDFVDLGIPFKD
jgi:hypothetical protein